MKSLGSSLGSFGNLMPMRSHRIEGGSHGIPSFPEVVAILCPFKFCMIALNTHDSWPKRCPLALIQETDFTSGIVAHSYFAKGTRMLFNLPLANNCQNALHVADLPTFI